MKSILGKKWLWLLVCLVLALQVYLVRELLAALLVFTVLFAMVGAIALLYFVAREASHRGFAWLQPHLRTAAVVTRRGFSAVEEISKKPFRRPRSEPAR